MEKNMELYHPLLGLVMKVRTNSLPLFEVLQRIYCHFNNKVVTPSRIVHLDIEEKDNVFNLVLDYKVQMQVSSWEMAAGMVVEILSSHLVLYDEDWCFFHGGLARLGGKTVLVAGHSSAGKSTLLATLGVHGFEIGADDVIPLVIKNGVVYTTAYPLPFFLRESAANVIYNSKLTQLDTVVTYSGRNQEYEYRFLSFPDRTMRTDCLYAIDFMFFPNRTECFSDNCKIDLMKQSETMIELLKNSRNPQTMDQNRKIALLMARKGRAFRLEYKQARDAVERIVCCIGDE